MHMKIIDEIIIKNLFNIIQFIMIVVLLLILQAI
jgi:hypothetical protein